MASDYTKRTDLLLRWNELKNERSSWWSHWQEISTYIIPWGGRFFRQDRDNGRRRSSAIIDNTGIRSLKTLGAGLMAGATSPARPWFRLGTHDPDLNDAQPVKLWLSDVALRMHAVYQKSNTYRALHQMYHEMGAFGTAANVILPNFNTVIHNYPLTCGEYAIATDAQGEVVTLYREYEMTVSQLVKEFGLLKCSTVVQSLYDRGLLGNWIPVIHAIEPRYDRNPRLKDTRNMAWGSFYFELGGDQETFLRESGFKQFPAVCPRWDVAGGDMYGNSPGMEALGDIKALQQEQLRKAQGIDYQSKPPLQIPTQLKNHEVDTMPGGITYRPPGAPGDKIESLWDVRLDLQYLIADIGQTQERIERSFFYDIFRMFDGMDDTKMTATEVAARQEEKMLMLGPVLERLNNELLYPLIETTFTHMVEMNAIPPPPQELKGMDLGIEFISVLAQAQRAIGVNSVDRFVGSLGVVAQLKPEVSDKFDSDAWADKYADMLGIDPAMVIASDQVALVRQQRAKAQAAQQTAAVAEQAGGAARNFAQAQAAIPQNGPGSDILNQFSGYQSPAPTEVQ